MCVCVVIMMEQEILKESNRQLKQQFLLFGVWVVEFELSECSFLRDGMLLIHPKSHTYLDEVDCEISLCNCLVSTRICQLNGTGLLNITIGYTNVKLIFVYLLPYNPVMMTAYQTYKNKSELDWNKNPR